MRHFSFLCHSGRFCSCRPTLFRYFIRSASLLFYYLPLWSVINWYMHGLMHILLDSLEEGMEYSNVYGLISTSGTTSILWGRLGLVKSMCRHLVLQYILTQSPRTCVTTNWKLIFTKKTTYIMHALSPRVCPLFTFALIYMVKNIAQRKRRNFPLRSMWL